MTKELSIRVDGVPIIPEQTIREYKRICFSSNLCACLERSDGLSLGFF